MNPCKSHKQPRVDTTKTRVDVGVAESVALHLHDLEGHEICRADDQRKGFHDGGHVDHIKLPKRSGHI